MSGYGNAANVAENNRHESVRNRCIVMFTRSLSLIITRNTLYFIYSVNQKLGEGGEMK